MSGDFQSNDFDAKQRKIEELQKIKSELVAINQNLNMIDKAFDARAEARYRSTFGENFDRMIRDRNFAESALTNEDPIIIHMSLSIIADVWAPSESLVERCFAMAAGDEDGKVRASALYKLGAWYANKREVRVLELLVTTLEDVSENILIRKA